MPISLASVCGVGSREPGSYSPLSIDPTTRSAAIFHSSRSPVRFFSFSSSCSIFFSSHLPCRNGIARKALTASSFRVSSSVALVKNVGCSLAPVFLPPTRAKVARYLGNCRSFRIRAYHDEFSGFLRFEQCIVAFRWIMHLRENQSHRGGLISGRWRGPCRAGDELGRGPSRGEERSRRIRTRHGRLGPPTGTLPGALLGNGNLELHRPTGVVRVCSPSAPAHGTEHAQPTTAQRIRVLFEHVGGIAC